MRINNVISLAGAPQRLRLHAAVAGGLWRLRRHLQHAAGRGRRDQLAHRKQGKEGGGETELNLVLKITFLSNLLILAIIARLQMIIYH